MKKELEKAKVEAVVVGGIQKNSIFIDKWYECNVSKVRQNVGPMTVMRFFCLVQFKYSGP